jgi:hypothetical protein
MVQMNSGVKPGHVQLVFLIRVLFFSIGYIKINKTDNPVRNLVKPKFLRLFGQ